MTKGPHPATRHGPGFRLEAAVVLGLPAARLLGWETGCYPEAFQKGDHTLKHLWEEIFAETGDEELYVHIVMLLVS